MQTALRQLNGTHPANVRGLGHVAADIAAEVDRAEAERKTGRITVFIDLKDGIIKTQHCGGLYEKYNRIEG